MADNKSAWVDFRLVKQAVTMPMVLERYHVTNLRTSGTELIGRCPIHKGEGERSFHVNVSKNVFHCFSCKARGNVLDFVAAMEKCSVRDAALKLAEWFNVGEQGSAPATAQGVSLADLEAVERQFAELQEAAARLGEEAAKGLALVAAIKERLTTSSETDKGGAHEGS